MHKMQYAVVRAAKSVVFQDGVGIAGEVAIGEVEQLDASDRIERCGLLTHFARPFGLRTIASGQTPLAGRGIGRYVSHVDLLALNVSRFKSNCWAISCLTLASRTCPRGGLGVKASEVAFLPSEDTQVRLAATAGLNLLYWDLNFHG